MCYKKKRKTEFRFLFIVVLLTQLVLGFSQSRDIDTLDIKAGNFVIINDVVYTILKDTTIIVPDTSETRIVPINEKNRKSLKNTLTFAVDSSRWYYNIYDMAFQSVFKKNKTYAVLDTGGYKLAAEEYKKFSGTTISKIEIIHVDVIEGSIWDTTQQAITWFGKKVNQYHKSTRLNLIKKYLSFKEGDNFSPSEIADNEQIIRALSFIEDARFIAKRIEGEPDKTRLIIIIKDRMPVAGKIVVINQNRGRFGLDHRNIMGYGIEFQNTFSYNLVESPPVEYDGTLIFHNLLGNYMDVSLFYSNREDYDLRKAAMNKEFITPKTKYAGGVEISDLSTFKITNPDTVNIMNRYRLKETDYWFGRSFQIGGIESRSSWMVAARHLNLAFAERPEIKPDSNFFFHDRNWILAAIGNSKIIYFKSRLIYGYGQTEDVPTGLFTNFTIGYGKSQFENNLYGGIVLKAGNFIKKLGYLGGVAELGGFYRHKEFENSIFNSKLVYFSNLIKANKFRLRQFIDIGYTLGFNRYTTDKISISNDNGIRGLSGGELTGLQRLYMRFETVAFTPWSWLEFNSAFFAFFDLAFIGDGERTPFNEKKYEGVGAGFRLRNESLVFDTFQFRFSFYPRVPTGGSQYRFDFIFNIPRKFTNLRQGRPQFVEFK